MSVPLPQGYINSNEVFIDQSRSQQAGPSNYARPPPPAPQAPPHLQGPPPQTPFYSMNGHLPPGYPVHISQPQHIAQQQFMAPYPPPSIISNGQPGMVYPGFEMNAGAAIPNFHFGSVPQNGVWMDEWVDGGMSHEGQDMVYSNLEVKHRRRTTPDQLRILEYWYEINPKPDNSLREHLAAQLGMTKRNVQVWFQNRRAKMKGLAKKDDKLDGEDEQQTPEKPSNINMVSPIQQQPIQRQMLLPPMGPPPMARRASLANGEAAKIEMFVAKRAAAAAGGQNRGLRPPGFVSPQRSPLMGQASAARRQSIPYPTPITAGPGGPGGPGPSPKISPVVRVMPSALHLTAMRNNTRRASMPGAAQLISSGPFTPPRLVTNQHQVGLPRELSTIKDDDSIHSGNGLDGQQHQQQQQLLFDPESDFTTTYITPPPSGYDPSSVSPISFLPTDGSSTNTTYDPSIPFSPNSPLPNPSFTFGTEGHQAQHGQQQMHKQPQFAILDDAEAARQQQLFLAFQQRGRMGSIASNGTYTTDNGNGTDYEDNSLADWMTQESNAGTDGTVGNGNNGEGQEGPDGFDPDTRRASAPADLLHQIGIMGLGNNIPTPIRPSPLGSHFTPDNYHSENTYEGSEFPMSGTGIPSSELDPSPISMSSIPSSSSESVSPSENQQFQFLQGGNYNPNLTQQQQNIPGPHQPVRSISLQQFPSSHSNSNLDGGMNNYSNPSVSPYSEHSIPSHQAYNQQQQQQQQQQNYQNSLFDGYQPNSNIQQNQNQIRMQHQKSGSGSGQNNQNKETMENKDDFSFFDNLNNENGGISV